MYCYYLSLPSFCLFCISLFLILFHFLILSSFYHYFYSPFYHSFYSFFIPLSIYIFLFPFFPLFAISNELRPISHELHSICMNFTYPFPISYTPLCNMHELHRNSHELLIIPVSCAPFPMSYTSIPKKLHPTPMSFSSFSYELNPISHELITFP